VAYIAYNRIPIAPTDKARTAMLIASIQSNRAMEWAFDLIPSVVLICINISGPTIYL
jgi:hypothetical protein